MRSSVASANWKICRDDKSGLLVRSATRILARSSGQTTVGSWRMTHRARVMSCRLMRNALHLHGRSEEMA